MAAFTTIRKRSLGAPTPPSRYLPQNWRQQVCPGTSGVGHDLLDLLAQALKNIGATEFVLSPKEVVAGIPPLKDGGIYPTILSLLNWNYKL